MEENISYEKYLKYKSKYTELKYNQTGSGLSTYIDIMIKNNGDVENKRYNITSEKEDIETRPLKIAKQF